ESRPRDLRGALHEVLRTLDVQDADHAFRAIVRASPAGLGRTERHDVFAPATVSLRAAMAEAADRDRIAHQYVTDFAAVFTVGEPCLAQSLAASPDRRLATVSVFLTFLAASPDSHILRKQGAAIAERVRRDATMLHARTQAARRLDD